jgi:hypothetical protein
VASAQCYCAAARIRGLVLAWKAARWQQASKKVDFTNRRRLSSWMEFGIVGI